MKWVWIIVLLVVGVLAALSAVEYLTVSIHAVPSFLGRRHGRGHYRKRGAGAALVALIAFVAAGYLFYRMRQAGRAAMPTSSPPSVPPSSSPAGQLPTESAGSPDQPAGQ